MNINLRFLARLRFLLPLLAFFIYAYSVILLVESDYEKWVLHDYAAWLATFLVCSGVYADLRLLGDKFSSASTLLLSLASAALAVSGRILSLLLNLLIEIPYSLIPLFGSIYTHDSFILLLVSLLSSSALASTTLLAHSILGKPVVVYEAKPLNHSLKWVWKRLLEACSLIWRNDKFCLVTAFLIGFLYRFLPELLWWPWPIGWDTVEYIAHLMDFTETLNPFASYYWMGSMRNCPPLLNVILLPIALVIGAWNTFKIYPAVAYGFLSFSSALLARRVFKLDGVDCLFASAITILYILNLRISWDYQRQLLGSVFMLLALAAIDSYEKINLKRVFAIIVLVVCCALSHEVTAFFSAIVSLALILRSVKGSDYNGLVAGLIGLSASVLLETWYWKQPYTPSKIFGLMPLGVVSYSEPAFSEVLSYLMAGYGLTLPFVLLVILSRESKALYTKISLIILVIAGLSPRIAPYTSVATWYRFLIGAAPIASTLAGVGIVKTINNRRFHMIFIIFMMLLALPYTYGVDETSKFVSVLREFPKGMTPSPMESRLLNDLIELT
ncbi:MAG: hypothetical protein QXZ04_05210, partial [Thermoproteota archaeon]